MKKPSILNRPMFNKGGSSAYGRGIASNLVSEEQRQRYNYGGRVRLANGTQLNSYLMDPNLTRQQFERIQNIINKDYLTDAEYEAQKEKSYESMLESQIGGPYGPDDEYNWAVDMSSSDSLPNKAHAWYSTEAGKKKYMDKAFSDTDKQRAEDKLLAQKYSDVNVEGLNVVEKDDTSLDDLLADKTETKAPDAITGKNLPKDDESDILGLTPEERKALGSSMWFNMAAAGAGSKGKTVGEVLKDTLAGGAATTAKMVDPTTRMALRTKYEKAGEEARKTDQAEWDRKIKYGKSEEGQIDKVQELLKIPDRETAREVLYFGQGGIQKVSPKRKKDYEVYVANEEGYINSKGGAIFDEAIGEYVFYIDGKKYTTKDKSKAMKAKKKGLI